MTGESCDRVIDSGSHVLHIWCMAGAEKSNRWMIQRSQYLSTQWINITRGTFTCMLVHSTWNLMVCLGRMLDKRIARCVTNKSQIAPNTIYLYVVRQFYINCYIYGAHSMWYTHPSLAVVGWWWCNWSGREKGASWAIYCDHRHNRYGNASISGDWSRTYNWGLIDEYTHGTNVCLFHL